jgi:hypothetical protein
MRRVPIRGLVLLAAIAVACAQRSPERPEVGQAIAALFQMGSGTIISLAEAAPFAWTRVCVIPPYANWGAVDDALGFKWRGARIDLHEAYNLVVFIDQDRAVGHVEHPRRHGDFALDHPACYTRLEARFRVVESRWFSDWLVLKPLIVEPAGFEPFDRGM